MIFHEFTVQVFLNKVNEAININSIIRKKKFDVHQSNNN